MKNKNMNIPTKYEDTPYYRCNCPICQAMKKADEEDRSEGIGGPRTKVRGF